jgi:protein tyrosine phosphatase (PTP) superfamily phosphohydrolase (DUF442 family)
VPLSEIRNFVWVSDTLATAGQPTEEQLREIAENGFEVVVNLGILDPRYCLPDEEGSVKGFGLAYHHIPVEFKGPRLEDFVRFEGVMEAVAGQRTFVHCAANYRVSCFIALYGERHFGWSPERALVHVHGVWRPDETWQAFMVAVESELGPGAPGARRA